jgi:mono/diheme cytochrome c family protein
MKTFVFLAAVSALLAACGGDGAANPAAVAEAKKLWTEKCVTCHGDRGMGDGPDGALLDPKPRVFKDPKWQMQTKDERIAKVIVEGGASVGLSANMTPNPELADKPEVVAELVKKVRSFR